MPLEREKLSFDKVYRIVKQDYAFSDKAQACDFFTRLTGLFKNFNYASPDSPDYAPLLRQIDDLVAMQGAPAPA